MIQKASSINCKKIAGRGLIIAIAMIGSISCAQDSVGNINCQVDNGALQSMPQGVVKFIKKNGEQLELQVKLADNVRTRAAGFQRVCAGTVSKMPILFVFEAELVPSFHMHNVVTPLGIAFISSDGRVDSVHTMDTYIVGSNQRPLYRSNGPVVAALEVEPTFFTRHGIDKSSRLEWMRVAD